MTEVRLKVVEIRQKDVGRGIARVDKRTVKKLGISFGEVVVIVGEKKTAAITWPSYKEDKNKDIIRVDDFIRKNARVAQDEHVTVLRADVRIAEKIVLAPVDMRLNVDQDFVDFMKDRLKERVLFEQDLTVAIMLGHAIPFHVVSTLPHGVPVKLSKDTVLKIMNVPYPPPDLKLKTPTDIRYLLRFDWLDNLVTRIKAKRVVFSIPEIEISSEEEEELIDPALKNAYQKMPPTQIKVIIKSDGKTFGTFPWAEIDMHGRITAIYPDIPPPPMAPTFSYEMNYGRVIPPMKRCFKTGVSNCPKDIHFSPRSVVVAMPFSDEFKDAGVFF